jgi:pseudaminic acid cytidylyltransferase
MNNVKKIIAIIPARGGSKRIPKKNIKDFCGKPIIAYSICAALESKLFDKVIVSTDDAQIAQVAKEYGADVPFVRPSEIADDFATTNEVIAHALNWYKARGEEFDLACCIYATAPLIRPYDLNCAVKLFDDQTDYVFSATEFSYPIARSFRLLNENKVEMFWPENYHKRSQDLEVAYHDAGMFYFGLPRAYLEDKPLFAQYSKAYVLPHYRVQDIDTLDDWRRASNYYLILRQQEHDHHEYNYSH